MLGRSSTCGDELGDSLCGWVHDEAGVHARMDLGALDAATEDWGGGVIFPAGSVCCCSATWEVLLRATDRWEGERERQRVSERERHTQTHTQTGTRREDATGTLRVCERERQTDRQAER